MSELEKYRASPSEKARTDDLVRLLPRGRQSVLDIGARDGHFARILTEYFPEVTALDIEPPSFQIPGVVTVAGNIKHLEFPDNSFDCVFCAEVLEHIDQLQVACNEIVRVARHDIIVGVPFLQDTRVGRTTCSSCGRVNPPWGHVNSFDENRIVSLFPGVRLRSKSFVGVTKEATNRLSTFLTDLAGNPWGSYDQDEPCIYCNAKLLPPPSARLSQKLLCATALKLNGIQSTWTRPHGIWIHVAFSKQ